MDNLDENIYQKIQDIFGNMPSKFSVLEEEIDIEQQMEYFEFSKLHKNDIPKNKILENKEELLNPKISIYDKKLLLVQLASLEDVPAYRAIEEYLKNPDKELKNWAVIAAQESRMVLETSLLEENQVFISTGLGGKGRKLRYFIVVIYSKNKEIGNVQRKVIENEFNFVLEKYDSEIEIIQHSNFFSKVKALIPINIPINEVIKRAIAECNQYGNFLEIEYIITNVKVLDDKEITDFLNKKKKKE